MNNTRKGFETSKINKVKMDHRQKFWEICYKEWSQTSDPLNTINVHSNRFVLFHPPPPPFRVLGPTGIGHLPQWFLFILHPAMRQGSGSGSVVRPAL